MAKKIFTEAGYLCPLTYNSSDFGIGGLYKKSECKNKINVDLEDYIEATEVEDDGRGMGTKYSHNLCASIICDICKSEIEIVGTVWEYPEGVINLDETEIIYSDDSEDEEVDDER